MRKRTGNKRGNRKETMERVRGRWLDEEHKGSQTKNNGSRPVGPYEAACVDCNSQHAKTEKQDFTDKGRILPSHRSCQEEKRNLDRFREILLER
ncbi:hypothetical protein E2C01_101939 [Portunus trituberculatus]|uniref:Uncharacterized protein n=1 Tax=Portunus trituberculatus TaxID=210409 RepID=A0A5B7KLE9_PORTR|nr:hypothetical protein [Portunus trituberculatus]